MNIFLKYLAKTLPKYIMVNKYAISWEKSNQRPYKSISSLG